MISEYDRIFYDINLQKMYEVLDEVWSFASAMDVCTHMCTSYLESSFQLQPNRYGIVNVRILAVSFYGWHTAEMIFDTAARTVDVLCPTWRTTITGISTDRDATVLSGNDPVT